MGAERRYPALNFFAQFAPGNRRRASDLYDLDRPFDLIDFIYRGEFNPRLSVRLLPGDKIEQTPWFARLEGRAPLSISSHTSAREHFSKKRAINQAVLLCDIQVWKPVAVAKRSFFMVSTNCQAPGIELGIGWLIPAMTDLFSASRLHVDQ